MSYLIRNTERVRGGVVTLVAVLASLFAQAQFTGTYQCKIDIKIRDEFGNASDDCTNNFEMTPHLSDESSFQTWDQNLNPIGEGWKNYSKTYTFDGAVYLKSLEFRGVRRFKKTFVVGYSCNNASGSGDIKINDLPVGPLAYGDTYGDMIPAYTSEVTVKVIPLAVNIYYLNAVNVVEPSVRDFPSEHTATLKAYPEAAYTWEYQKISGGAWVQMPAAFQNKSTIQVKGYDLFSETEFMARLKTSPSVIVRVKYEGVVKKTFTLAAMLSSPRIVGVEPIMESCHGANDGKLKICFSRALYPAELLNIALNNDEMTNNNGSNISSFDAGNCYTITGREPIAYNLSLLGTFNIDGTPDVDPTYTSGLDHKWSTRLDSRPAISNFMGDSAPVHCYGGKDGWITVSAQGGTGTYTSYLVLGSDTVQQIGLNSVTPGRFADLKKEYYVVRLKDSNGCDPKKSNGDIDYRDYTIAEPVNKIMLSSLDPTEPLGFGLQNGHITARAEEGTFPYTFEWTNTAGAVLTPEGTVIEAASMKSKLSGIGKGTYHVLARDASFALAFPQTEENIRGCYDTLSIELDQPPLLEVFMEEYRFVSCNGYTDGKLVAHANGGRPYLAPHIYQPYQYEWFSVSNATTLTAFGSSDSIATDRPSAMYRIKVTDRNGIIAWSPDFHLIQPDVLKIQFTTSELLCNGDSNGTSTALVTGGTSDYQYTWSTEETTAAIANLTDGWYSLIVTDERHCTTYGQTQVKVPNSLEVEAAIHYPVCNGYNNGSIELTTTGGLAPYTYAWQHEATALSVADHLGQGEYHVRVSDANDCFVTRDYILEDPALSPVDLGPDRVLCKDQSLDLDVSASHPASVYAWTRDGVPVATTAAVQLQTAGTYHLTITDSNGCVNEDEVTLSRDDTEISASIMVATRAPQAEKVTVANISYPVPDRIEWIIPKEATVLNEATGHLDLSFLEKGTYSIGLTSYKGECLKTTYSNVTVVDKKQLADYQAPDEPYIKQFLVTPNPNDGRFSVKVELREAGDFNLTLHTAQGTFVTQKEIKEQAIARVDFDVSSMAGKGVYVLQLVTAQGYSTFKVIIQ